MARSPFGELPAPDDDGSWAGEPTTWGGRGRMSVVVVLGVLAAVLVVVLALTFLTDSDARSGTAAVGAPPPVPAADVAAGTPVQLGGYGYEVGVGPFVASTRGAPAGSHLLLATLVVRNSSGAPAPNPLRSLRVQVGLAALPESVTTGPSAVLCQNRPAVSPLGAGPASYPGLAPGSCVLEARTSGAGPAMLAPDEEARGMLLSTPVPDAVTDTAASVWTETTPGTWQRVG
ncbi:hypothetical protein [Actinomycetospora termitidis]|uniref:DUF4352 domain-containing protein n=1 Tax=Actinomycetospora termitidis TaxID=3053470 RepID=A0ABT7MI70_9PSEU|nr:hypothetical protein [Actinomycetospora sp. Odt1-22]MDL5159587.1 hypothetical protein [Actinomycetospora sp. Odt1-22]